MKACLPEDGLTGFEDEPEGKLKDKPESPDGPKANLRTNLMILSEPFRAPARTYQRRQGDVPEQFQRALPPVQHIITLV